MEGRALDGWVERFMALFFVDSNVLIYSQVMDLPEFERASAKLEEIKNRGDIAVNAVIVSEFFYVLSKFLGNVESSKRIRLFLESSKVLYLPIEKSTMIKAMKRAVARSQKINDMVVAQHAIDTKADWLLTDNLKHFAGIPELATRGLQ